MTTARRRLVDPAVTRWYHCISRCVRRAFLLGEDGLTNRKAWIQNRLQELCQVFSISVAGFSILDNHLHVLARLDPEVAKTWSDEEVAKRWANSIRHAIADARNCPFPRSGCRSESKIPSGSPKRANDCKV